MCARAVARPGCRSGRFCSESMDCIFGLPARGFDIIGIADKFFLLKGGAFRANERECRRKNKSESSATSGDTDDLISCFELPNRRKCNSYPQQHPPHFSHTHREGLISVHAHEVVRLLDSHLARHCHCRRTWLVGQAPAGTGGKVVVMQILAAI